MKRRWAAGCALSILAGAALHFLYDLWPNALTACFAPVNESVWEHGKLVFWPMLAAGFVGARGIEDRRAYWRGVLTGLLAAWGALVGAYYTLAAGFGVQALAVDIGLYVLCMAGGFAIAARLRKRRRPEWLCGVTVIAAGVYGAALVLFSFAPPQLPIFQPPG